MRHIVFSILLALFSCLSGDYTPNFTIELEEVSLEGIADSKGYSECPALYQVRCMGVEKNIDVVFTAERMDGGKSSIKSCVDEEGYLALRSNPDIRLALAFKIVPGEYMKIHVISREFFSETKTPVFYAKLIHTKR